MSTYSNPLTEFSMQWESGPDPEFGGGSGAGVFNEQDEMELAAELLDVSNEQELDQFLGDLISKAGRAIGSVVNSPIGKAVGGVLKAAAGKALPIAGGALGAYFGGPLGARIGSGLASMAGQALGLELEGLSPEDQEFEASKQFVRFAGETVRQALQSASGSDPAQVAATAAAQAARAHAPGLANVVETGAPQSGRQSGRWIRRHGKIILLGV